MSIYACTVCKEIIETGKTICKNCLSMINWNNENQKIPGNDEENLMTVITNLCKNIDIFYEYNEINSVKNINTNKVIEYMEKNITSKKYILLFYVIFYELNISINTIISGEEIHVKDILTNNYGYSEITSEYLENILYWIPNFEKTKFPKKKQEISYENEINKLKLELSDKEQKLQQQENIIHQLESNQMNNKTDKQKITKLNTAVGMCFRKLITEKDNQLPNEVMTYDIGINVFRYQIPYGATWYFNESYGAIRIDFTDSDGNYIRGEYALYLYDQTETKMRSVLVSGVLDEFGIGKSPTFASTKMMIEVYGHSGDKLLLSVKAKDYVKGFLKLSIKFTEVCG